MKKTLYFFISLLLFVGLYSNIMAQTKQDTIPTSTADIIRTVNDLKSGNWQDVLSNFSQLGLSDLTSPNKSFNFKSTLFAVKLKTNPTLNIDTNYINHTADRNLQFNFSLRIDTQYHFNGFSGGITYAINKRDTTLISFINNNKNNFDQIWQSELKKLMNDYIAYENIDTSTGKQNWKKVKVLIKQMGAIGRFDVSSFPLDFQAMLIKDSIPDKLNNVFQTYLNEKANTMQKGLFTFSLNGAVNKISCLDSAQFGIVYLQGVTKGGKPLELDARANIGIKDTLINKDNYRTQLNSSIGFNYALITNRANASVFECKPYFEYDRIFSGILPEERAEKFLANLDFRLRITPEIWIPFTVKYDIKNRNFLGFLNVTANFSALKSIFQIKAK